MNTELCSKGKVGSTTFLKMRDFGVGRFCISHNEIAKNLMSSRRPYSRRRPDRSDHPGACACTNIRTVTRLNLTNLSLSNFACDKRQPACPESLTGVSRSFAV